MENLPEELSDIRSLIDRMIAENPKRFKDFNLPRLLGQIERKRSLDTLIQSHQNHIKYHEKKLKLVELRKGITENQIQIMKADLKQRIEDYLDDK